MKRFIIASAAAAVLIIGFWLVAVPESLMADLLARPLGGSGLRVETASLRKGLFYNFSAGTITLTKDGRPLISVENVRVKINPLLLFLLKLRLKLSGNVAGGDFRSVVDLARSENSISIDADRAAIQQLPFLSEIGLKGSGLLSGRALIKKGSGDITFSTSGMRLKSMTLGGVSLPLDMFDKARGAIVLNGRVLSIVSFTLDGTGIYARLRGTLSGNVLDGSMEIMPEKSFASTDILFAMMKRYETSPGHYVVPLKSRIQF